LTYRLTENNRKALSLFSGLRGIDSKSIFGLIWVIIAACRLLSIDSSVDAVLPVTPSPSALFPPISLDRPAFLRKHLPDSLEGWPCKEYYVGPENAGLDYLFQTSTIANLASISPVLVYGERDLGRTDLAITLAVRWSKLVNQKPLHLTTGLDFCRDYANALEIGDIQSFRNRLANCKMLIIDDFDPLADKPAAQQELACILDGLSAVGVPVLVTSSALPTSLGGVTPRLSSRLASGFSIHLVNPDRDARAALIGGLVTLLDPELPLPVLIAIADELSTDQPLSPSTIIRLVKLAHQNRLENGRLDLPVLRSLLKQYQLDEAPSIHLITKAVSRKMRVKLADVRGTCRLSKIVRARGLAILLSRQWTTLSLHQIGQYFGGRDHSTILHACRKTSRLLSEDSELGKICQDIQNELLG
jgi:chromosomal replication initiator protein